MQLISSVFVAPRIVLDVVQLRKLEVFFLRDEVDGMRWDYVERKPSAQHAIYLLLLSQNKTRSIRRTMPHKNEVTRKIPRRIMHLDYIIPTPMASSRLTRIDPSLLLVPCDLVVGAGELT